MTSERNLPQDRDTCRKLINLGYARSSRVRLYGSEVELTSDPYPDRDGGFEVEARDTSSQQSSTRRIKLPLTVVQVASSTPEKKSA
jgi:hypothetical protein